MGGSRDENSVGAIADRVLAGQIGANEIVANDIADGIHAGDFHTVAAVAGD
ncbi:hypothetical protein D3C83_236180 [compost metagenome]